MLSLYGFDAVYEKYQDDIIIRSEPGRMQSYVISEIDFLGARTIIVYGDIIFGLKMVASIWTVVDLGSMLNAGMQDHFY